MTPRKPGFGPLQLLVVGFERTDRFRGEIARELQELRGRGLIRVLDARFLSRSADGELSELDLTPLIGETAGSGRPVAHLFGLNGAAHAGNGDGGDGAMAPEMFGATVGFTLEDLRRLTDEIGPGDHAAVVLVEHVWAARLREKVRAAGGRLTAQGMLTPEVVMLVGAELQAMADAEAAIELAEAARGSALLEALDALTGESASRPPEPRPEAAAAVVRALVDAGFIRDSEAEQAVGALAERGIVEKALLHGAVAEAEELLGRGDEDGP
jgi:uncharacterized membrane protein